MRWIALFISFLTVAGMGLAHADTAQTDTEANRHSARTEQLLYQAGIVSGTLAETNHAESLLAIGPELRAFIDAIEPEASPSKRFREILSTLKDDGFQLEFDLNRTTSASEAFRDRRGNCISFTALMVAIARDVGLEAHFNLVDSPVKRSASKNSKGRQIVRNVQHVNAKVTFGWIVKTIEFNFEPQLNFPDRQLSDSEAQALYLNNLALESSRQGNHAQSFVFMREALAHEPSSSQIWNTLGYLYRQKNMLGLAEMSFTHAIHLDEFNASAIRNLRHVNRLQERAALSSRIDLDKANFLDALSGS